MPDKGSAERVTGTFNEPGFSTKAVDTSAPCSWVSTLLSSWPGARATGQGPMASNVCVADRLMSPHTRHQTERLSPTGTEGADPRTELPPFPFLSRYPLFMLGSAVDVWRLRGTGFPKDMNYRRHGVSGGRSPDRDRLHRGRVEERCHGTVRGTSPGRAAAGTRFQSPTQIDRVVCGWACARVLRFGAAPVGKNNPMIRRAG